MTTRTTSFTWILETYTFSDGSHQKMCRFLESMWMMLYVWSLVNDLNHSWLLTIATMTLLISFLSQLILTDSEKMIIYMICFSVLLILSFGYALFINKKMKIPHYRHSSKSNRKIGGRDKGDTLSTHNIWTVQYKCVKVFVVDRTNIARALLRTYYHYPCVISR
jgi:hypothetical protein